MATGFTTTLDASKDNLLLQSLHEQAFNITTPPFTKFSAKKPGISCTLYQSGKLVIQGKASSEWIEFFIEPVILERLEYTANPIWFNDFQPHLGSDETGKGDLFGPLCVACVMVEEKHLKLLSEWKVQDSKCVNDKNIRSMALNIWKNLPCCVKILMPKAYNPLWHKFKNLNRLLAWMHAEAINEMLNRLLPTPPLFALVDKFCNHSGIASRLVQQSPNFKLIERVRAEDDPAVAAASILARAAFLKAIADLSQEANFAIPKGSGAPAKLALEHLLKRSPNIDLSSFVKTHFKTVQEVKDLLS
jgi:ribonuclease HIII